MELRQFCHHVWRSALRMFGYLLKPKRILFLSLVMYDYGRFVVRLRRDLKDPLAFKVLKKVELAVQRVAIGALPQRKPRYFQECWVKTDRWGVPLRLHRLRKLARNRARWAKASALFVAGSFRALEGSLGWKYPRSELELRKPRFHISRPEFLHALDSVLSEARCDRLRPLSSDLFATEVWRSTAGVYGRRSVATACQDAYALFSERGRPGLGAMLRLYEALSHRCRGGPVRSLDSFTGWLRRLASACGPSPASTKRPLCLGAFVYVNDRGGKLRGVTPLNYHLQNALKAVHRPLMSCLRALRSIDATFDEATAIYRLREWTARGLEVCSYDLPDATSQFPAEVMAWVVGRVLGWDVSREWFAVIRSEWYFHGIGFRRYARGAPMGAYSVWPAFALAHHAIVRMAALRASAPMPFRQYVIRGDDNCIASPPVAFHYKAIWRGLGQEPSPEKSLESSIAGPGVALFAKRHVVRGFVLEAVTYAELRAAVFIEPLALARILPAVAGLFNSVVPAFGLDSFATIVRAAYSGSSFDWVSSLRAPTLSQSRAAAVTQLASSRCQRAIEALQTWEYLATVPQYWSRFFTVWDLPPSLTDKILEHFRSHCHDLVAQVAARLATDLGLRASGIVSWFQDYELQSRDLGGPGDALARLCARPECLAPDDHPFIGAALRSLDALKNVSFDRLMRDDVAREHLMLLLVASGQLEQYKLLSRVEFISLGLAKAGRATRLLAEKFGRAEWEEVSWDPVEYGAWVKTGPVSADLVLIGTDPPPVRRAPPLPDSKLTPNGGLKFPPSGRGRSPKTSATKGRGARAAKLRF